MIKNSQLNPEDFENLLNRLSDNREQAGAVYEKIRHGLIRYFRIRGCAEEENLTDETFNRVAKKIGDIATDRTFDPVKFCYGFARNIYLEYLVHRRQVEFNPDLNYSEPAFLVESEEDDARHSCLENCLGKLPESEKQIIIQYYSAEKLAKIKLRQKMAEDLNLSTKNLHTKIYRMRANLKKCIKKCLNEK